MTGSFDNQPRVTLDLDGRAGPARRISPMEVKILVNGAVRQADALTRHPVFPLRWAVAIVLGSLALSGGATASYLAIKRFIAPPTVIVVSRDRPARARPTARQPRPNGAASRAQLQERQDAPPAAQPQEGPAGPFPSAAASPAVPRQAAAERAGGSSFFDQLGAATRRRARGDIAGAHRIYASLARDRAHRPEGRTASLAAASLELESMRRPRAALQRYRALAASTSPAVAEEASYGIAQALRRLGETVQEAQALRQFVARHPHSPLRARAQQRLAKIAR